MSGFEVTPDTLRRAATGLETATVEIDRFWGERDRWLEAGRLVGSDRVQRGLAVFCEYWGLALRRSLDDSNALAERLRAASDTYTEAEDEVVR
ncbi:MAG: hypothetical protein OEZ14_11255 [Acidimicrobiia bacterium]|nr:hypothetical protein [Acidimicrobiia bacterium]MDH5521096.1 hypothetical protein [Acidimicrobiia bacterium]